MSKNVLPLVGSYMATADTAKGRAARAVYQAMCDEVFAGFRPSLQRFLQRFSKHMSYISHRNLQFPVMTSKWAKSKLQSSNGNCLRVVQPQGMLLAAVNDQRRRFYKRKFKSMHFYSALPPIIEAHIVPKVKGAEISVLFGIHSVDQLKGEEKT